MTTSKKTKVEPPKYNFILGPDWNTLDGKIPTRTFEKGELIRFGNHPNAEIDEVFSGNQYGVRAWGIKPVYGTPTEYEQFSVVNWYQIEKLGIEQPTSFTKKEEFYIRYSNSNISSLLSKVLEEYYGVDFTPSYQRDYVWEDKDKEALIDSIFNNISIGHFVFCEVPFKSNSKGYEALDGKQRLSTLVDFYEDRFQYQGYYFSQLSRRDKNHFENFGITFGVLEEPSEKQKYAAFIALNTSGKVMNESHLADVKEKYATLL